MRVCLCSQDGSSKDTIRTISRRGAKGFSTICVLCVFRGQTTCLISAFICGLKMLFVYSQSLYSFLQLGNNPVLALFCFNEDAFDVRVFVFDALIHFGNGNFHLV